MNDHLDEACTPRVVGRWHHPQYGSLLEVDGWPAGEQPQCRAMTVYGRRCWNPVFYGQVHFYLGPNDALVVTVEDMARLIEGVCPLHRRRGVHLTGWLDDGS